MSLNCYCPKCKKMLQIVQNQVTHQSEYVCYECSGVDLFIVKAEDALWKLNGKLVPFEQIKGILEQKPISEEDSLTTHFYGKRD